MPQVSISETWESTSSISEIIQSETLRRFEDETWNSGNKSALGRVVEIGAAECVGIALVIAKENLMRKFLSLAGLAAFSCLAVSVCSAAAPPASKGVPGTIVIVFKDGHRQSFNLSDIERVEFPASPAAASETGPNGSALPSRGRYLGKWEVGDGGGNNFFITLYDDGTARKSQGDSRGKWAYVDGEAQVTWDDGWRDAIRKIGSRFQKFAYSGGKSFSDEPDNVANARNTTPHPI